jgi:hypothetical protein
MEPIEVTARFNLTGRIDPIDFTWKGHHYRIESTGRRWDAPDGQHILVMSYGDRVYELLFSPSDRRWFLGEVGPHRIAA